jgi:dTDP-4-dehydrorhamnose 3,5-epimerase
MKFNELPLKGAYTIDVERIEDERGFFGRLWCKEEFENLGLKAHLVQSNISYSKKKGTLRGMHFQKDPSAEVKIVRCTAGSVYDVIVDLRKDSPTFKKWCGVELTATNNRMIYVPEHFAHGFITLEDNSEVYYLVSSFYNSEREARIRYDEPANGIHWPIDVAEISIKDKNHQNIREGDFF